MRFDDIMRYVPVNEDWENTSDEGRRRRYEKRAQQGLRGNRDYHQAKFEMDRQKGIGGDAGDISQYHNYPNERDFREAHLKDISNAKAALSDVYEKHLRPAAGVLYDCHETLNGLLNDNFRDDMSGVGRRTGIELRKLTSALLDAYDAIGNLRMFVRGKNYDAVV